MLIFNRMYPDPLFPMPKHQRLSGISAKGGKRTFQSRSKGNPPPRYGHESTIEVDADFSKRWPKRAGVRVQGDHGERMALAGAKPKGNAGTAVYILYGNLERYRMWQHLPDD
jgi:hypothetical protein